MNWKKIFKYLFLFFVFATIVMSYLSNRDLRKIYGGLTAKVDSEQFNPSSEPIAITNCNILSPDGDTFIANQTIIIEDGLIKDLDSGIVIQHGIKEINGEGKYLIPGLIDSHVHLFKSENDLLLYIANGITQVRELIGSNDILKWRQEIENGRIGPDMYVATPRLGTFGTIEGWFMSWSQMFDNIKNPNEARKAVDLYHKKGYDAIKIYSHLSKESYAALCDAALSKGMDVVGHIPWSIAFSDVWNSGQSDIAHLEEIMNAFRREFSYHVADDPREFLSYVDKRSKEISGELVKNDISVTTTLWLVESFVRQKFELENVLKEVALEYQNPGISEWVGYIPGGLGWLPEVNRYKLADNMSEGDKVNQKRFWITYAQACQIILKNISQNGVTILAGTDANLPPTVPGFSFHDELETMYKAGMTPAQVLRSATSAPAERFALNSGKIKLGLEADLVLLDNNPLIDIANTKSINSVILNGQVLDRELLDQILDAVKGANDKSRKKEISTYLN